jgi:hypothetical protein
MIYGLMEDVVETPADLVEAVDAVDAGPASKQ